MVTTESQSYDELVAGDVEEMYVTADATATIAKGQVLAYDSTNHNYINNAGGVTAVKYVVCNEAKTIDADTKVRVIVAGKVNKGALDATSQADADIEAALLLSGIIPLAQQA